MLFIFTLQLNCFDINSTVTYLRQSRQAIFEAWPSKILNSDQNHICQKIINNKQFSISIQIGTNTFTSTTLYTFDALSGMKIQINCSIAGQCLYASINQFSIAIFSLYFPTDDIKVSSVAGSLRNRIFDHLQCKTQAKTAISLLSGSEQVLASTLPVSECRVSPSSEMIKIMAYINGAPISEMPINLSTKFPPALHPLYIKYINDLPFVCASRPDQQFCIGMARALMQSEFINFVGGSRNKINVRYQGQVTQFDQNIKFLFTTIESAQTQDCFSSPVMTFYDKYLRVEADSGPCTKCSLAYFASIFSFDSIYLRFIMNVNEDYTGFKYLNEYQVTDYRLGTKFDKMLTCEMMTDVNACKTQLPLVLENMRDNSTIRLALVFKKNDAVVYKALYTPKISQPQIQTANVSIFDEKVCVKFQPVTDNEFLNVQVILHQLKLELQITTNTNTSVYCHQLDQAEKKQLNTILVDKKQLVATVNFDNVLVTDVPVLLIQQGDQPTFVWIIAAIIVVIAFIVIVFLQQCQK
ncbi:Conserved_hypothetical protein [Hexamita inflata]|uniref:Uncharacterized protein n=1 Tax=Hexamita inflata TaxID=28002 RepID=A0AA86NTL6_9EUKA|nr:Conserved hypothetical protein [Hexamita inflata]